MSDVPRYKARINPAMHRHPQEAAIVGRILVAFGELEYMTVDGAGIVLGRREPVQRALYRLRNTSSRIDAADAFMRPIHADAGLGSEYDFMISAIRHCLRIRNQYAHCNWGDDQSPATAGLFFTDVQESAWATDGFDHHWKHVDVAILEQQEAHFVYAQDWIYYLGRELPFRTGTLRENFFPKPLERAPAPLHNPPLLHIPPWLSADQKARHVLRALAAEGRTQTPTPAHLAMEAKREVARARRQADRDRAAAERSPKPPDHEQR